MKNASIQTLTAIAATFALLGLTGGSTVLADPPVSIQIIAHGTPPPPREDHQWASPYHTAIWIAGHYEWENGGYVWIGGYYSYPHQEINH